MELTELRGRQEHHVLQFQGCVCAHTRMSKKVTHIPNLDMRQNHMLFSRILFDIFLL